MIRESKRIGLTIATILVLFAGQSRNSFACPSCGTLGDPFALPHPHALQIAMATRRALDSGTLRSDAVQSSEEFESNLARLALSLVYTSARAKPVLIDILVVDEPAVFRVEVQGFRSRVMRLPVGNHPIPDRRVVTTVPVVNALGRFEMRIQEAFHNGSLEIETDAATQAEEEGAR